MTDFHHICLTIKQWLDAQIPEGSTGALMFASAGLQEALARVGFVAWAQRRFGSALASQLASRGPTVLLATLWGWATLGTFELDTAAKGFAAGVLGPVLLTLIRKPPTKPPGADAAPSGGPADTLRAMGGAAMILLSTAALAVVSCGALIALNGCEQLEAK